MFVSSGQFIYFLGATGFGIFCGIFFSLSKSVKIRTDSTVIKIISDVTAFLVVSVLYVAYSFYAEFPSFRPYMPVGVFIGIFLYMITFDRIIRIILAKIVKKLYNAIKKIKNKKNERLTKEKV